MLYNMRIQAEITLKIGGIQCASCVSAIDKAVKNIDGVSSFSLSPDTGIASAIIFPEKTSKDKIISVINSLGYSAKSFFYEDIDKSLKADRRKLLYRLGTAGFFSMQLMVASLALYSGYFEGIDETSKIFFQIISFILATPVVFYCGWQFHSLAVRGLLKKTITMDTLISIGTLTAYTYSIYQIVSGGEVYFDTASMIITFILAGRTIESYAKGDVSSVFKKFREFLKISASIVNEENGEIVQIPAEDIKKGRIFIVHPFDIIPCDGIIEEGKTEINESLLTGESLPVKKATGENIAAGTSNLWGEIRCLAVSDADNSYITDIMNLIKDALLQKPNAQRLADRVVAVFVPLVIATALLTFILHLAGSSAFSYALMSTISVLIVACPCALGLATPLAVSSAISKSTLEGVLLKNPESLETLKDINTVIFDKTGTLTSGSLELCDIVINAYAESNDEILCMASALEQNIDHPIAKAITASYKGELSFAVENIKYYPGLGAEGIIQGKRVFIGNEALLRRNGINDPGGLIEEKKKILQGGRIGVFYADSGIVKALLIFEDTLRKEAVEVIKKLKSQSIKTGMLTGDNETTAKRVQDILGLDFYASELLPEDKINFIKERKAKGEKILFAGDGINDTPSLVEADIGVAMNEPSQFAPLSSDIVLLNNNLNGVINAIETGKRTLRTIKLNLFWAFFYNIISIPFAAFGFFPPVLSAALMSLSSVSVCLNSVRK